MKVRAGHIANLAQQYCQLIEASDLSEVNWLQQVADLLPRLHAATISLSELVQNDGVGCEADLDARFELFTHLRQLLGERDGYWLEFDRIGDSHAMTGSLADDLTDIYCELKFGLRVLDQDPDSAVQGWLNGFESHLRQHLVDAERHLSALAAQDRLY